MATATTRFALSKPASGDNVSAFQGTVGTTLDAVDAAMIGLNGGAYAGGTTYHAGDVVTSGGRYYMSTATQTGTAPVTGSTTWLIVGGLFSDIQAATVLTLESTSSTTFAALTTAGPAVTTTVNTSGIVLVHISAQIIPSAIGALGTMGFAVSGASTVAATANQSISFQQEAAGGNQVHFGATFYLSGLSAGSTTFTAQYNTAGGNPSSFGIRHLVVQTVS